LIEYSEYNEWNVDAELAAELSESLLKTDALISAITLRKPGFAERMSDVISSAAARLRDLGARR